MGRHGLFIVLFILNIVCTAIARDICNNIENKSTMLRLKRYLLCEYDPDVRPVQNNKNVTHVMFRLMPQFYEYNVDDEIFSLHTWVQMEWNDSHLTWDPIQHDNIKGVPVTSDEIWTPDILPHSTERIGDSSDYGQVKAWVNQQGKIEWYTATKFSTYCVVDNTWWPYNTVNCTIQFGSWSHAGDEIDLVPYKKKPRLNWKDVNWNLVKFYVTTRENRYKYNTDSTIKMLSYHFILKRYWNIAHIIHISPIIVLMVMTLTALWLEPKSFERMMIANLNFVCHILCIQYIHWEMPKSGFNTPRLLVFYETSLAITSFTLILTSILRHLQELITGPPVWISAGTAFILRSRIGQIMLVSMLDPAVTAKIEIDADDNTDLVYSNNKKSSWKYVIILIGWLAFLSVLLTYIVLLSMCFPMYHIVS